MGMKTFIIIIIVFVVSAAKAKEEDHFKTYFHDYNACFLLKNIRTGKIVEFNKKQCYKRWKPCSTFKILNSLVALETNVLENELAIIKWDGKKQPYGLRSFDWRSGSLSTCLG